MTDNLREGDMVSGLGFKDYGIIRTITGPYARVKFGKRTVDCLLFDLTLVAQRRASEQGN